MTGTVLTSLCMTGTVLTSPAGEWSAVVNSRRQPARALLAALFSDINISSIWPSLRYNLELEGICCDIDYVSIENKEIQFAKWLRISQKLSFISVWQTVRLWDWCECIEAHLPARGWTTDCLAADTPITSTFNFNQ